VYLLWIFENMQIWRDDRDYSPFLGTMLGASEGCFDRNFLVWMGCIHFSVSMVAIVSFFGFGFSSSAAALHLFSNPPTSTVGRSGSYADTLSALQLGAVTFWTPLAC